MNEGVIDLYRLPNVSQYEDIHLLTLSETCSVLEERVYEIAEALPEKEKQTIKEYINNNYAGEKVVYIEKDRNDYEVKLSNRLELKFDKELNIYDIDD